MLVAIGETVALVTNRAVARAAVRPFLAFESFTTSAEFVHYSTELVPGFLLAAAVYAIACQAARPSGKNIWLAALLLGATPLSKLQATPIAGLLGLCLVIQEITSGRKRNLGRLIIGAMLPMLAAAIAACVTGQSENLLVPYSLQNLVYTQGGRQSIGLVSIQQWNQAVTNGYLALWLAGSLVFLVVAPAFAGNAPPPLQRFRLAAAVLLAMAIVCILVPGRPYNHYLNLMTMPLSLLLGSTLAVILQPISAGPASRRLILTGLFLTCCLAPQIVLRASNRQDPFEYYNTIVTDPGPAHRQLTQIVQAMTTPGEALGIWGWRSSLYVETGLRQATRQAHSEAQFVSGPWQRYFLRRYIEDIQASRPPVFVDAVGPGNFRFQDRNWGHEIFPLLDGWLRAHYTFVTELDGTRVYVRNDRFASRNRVLPQTSP